MKTETATLLQELLGTLHSVAVCTHAARLWFPEYSLAFEFAPEATGGATFILTYDGDPQDEARLSGPRWTLRTLSGAGIASEESGDLKETWVPNGMFLGLTEPKSRFMLGPWRAFPVGTQVRLIGVGYRSGPCVLEEGDVPKLGPHWTRGYKGFSWRAPATRAPGCWDAISAGIALLDSLGGGRVACRLTTLVGHRRAAGTVTHRHREYLLEAGEVIQVDGNPAPSFGPLRRDAHFASAGLATQESALERTVANFQAQTLTAAWMAVMFPQRKVSTPNALLLAPWGMG